MNSIQISSYHIQIEPDLDRFRFAGHAVITVEAKAPSAAITLNVLELSIDYCLFEQKGHQSACTYAIDASAEELRIELPQPVTGQFKLVIHYNGTINDKMAGFYRSSFTVEGSSESIAVTQFQESAARMAFPCQDHPKHKAHFEIELVVNDHLTAVSNTRIKEIHRLTSGKKRVCFHPTPLMSTYLVFFGVGRFDYIGDSEDRRLGLITTPSLSAYGKFGLSFGRKSLHFCEQYYGIDYPLDKMDLLAIPDFAFGAMENWGAITFRENLLLDFPDVTSQAGRLRICEVIAHEIAHQWFGNLVTPDDWKYLWLNESFATYFGYGVVDHYYPKWQIWEQFIYSQTQSALSRDSLLENFPIEIPGGEHVVINTSTAPLIYSKGGSILRQIEGFMGKELFREGIRSYLSAHAYACAASHHLWEAFEEVSKMPITALMKSWIEQPGHPVITAQRRDGKVILSQKRFTYLANESDQHWMVPVGITFFANDGSARTENVLMQTSRIEIDLAEGVNAYKLNPDQTGFYRVRYPDESDLEKLLELVAAKKIGPKDRWGLQSDLFAQVLCGNSTLPDYLKLLPYYMNEDDFLPLVSIMDNLFLAFRIIDQYWQPLIGLSGKAFAEMILNRMGWEPKADESHTTAVLRDHILYQAALFGLEETKKFATKQFAVMQKGSSIHPDIQKSVLQITALNGDRKTLDWFKKRAGASGSEHERLNLFTAIGAFADRTQIEAALSFALTDVPARNRFIPIAGAAENPHAASFLWQWYTLNVAQLEQMHPLLYERVIAAIVPVCGLHDQIGVNDFFNDYLKNSNLAADAIRLSLERMEIYSHVRRRHTELLPEQSTLNGI